MANVTHIADDPALRRIALAEEDLITVHALISAVQEEQTVLGAEVERHETELLRLQEALARENARHEVEKQKLLDAIQARRSRFASIVGVLATKYVRGPGRFDFKPDLGAFVETKE